MKQNKKPCIMTKKMIDRRKRSKALSEVKLAENISKNLQSFLEIFKRWSIFHINCKNMHKNNFMVPFYGWGSIASRLESFRWSSLLLPLSSQKFLVLILSTSERWQTESNLEPSSGFEHETPGFRILHLNH